MLTNIDFNRLKVFYYIYNCNSVIGAAGILNITRSAVSQHLKKLEDEVGSQLFTRVHKQLIPTSAANQLHEIVTPFFHELESGIKNIRQGKLEPTGILRIGAPVEFGKTYFPPIIATFRKLYKLVTFSLTLGDPDKLIAMIRKGDLDFALVDLFLMQGQYLADSAIYTTTPIIDEEVILVCSKEYHDDVLQGDCSLKNLLNCDFIEYQQNNLTLKIWFKHHYRKTVISPNIVLTVDSVRAVTSAVQNDVGLGIVPSHAVYDQINEGKIIPIRSRKKEIINSISLLQLLDKVPNLAEKRFQQFFQEKVGQERTLKNFSTAARK